MSIPHTWWLPQKEPLVSPSSVIQSEFSWACASSSDLPKPTWALQVSLQLMEQKQDVKHSINIEALQRQPQWMTVRHWRGPFLWADTIDLNIKTWCKMVIKSQLRLASMKTQLSVSERGAKRVPARVMTGESENKGGKTRGTKGERWGERMRGSSREQTQPRSRPRHETYLDECSAA